MSPQLLSGAARLAGSSLLRLQSDERLVALVRDGHDPAFTAVVERYRGELSRYATRLVGESRAEDVVQQAFVNAHGAMTSSDSDLQLRPWLYRIVHNAALNALRAARRTDELDERLAAAATVEHSVETRERLREALAAIAMLPEPQRDALVLQAVEGRSHEEIAAALGVTAGAARQHVHRARGMVRAAVSAVTPYGLLARFAMAGGAEPASNAALSSAGAAGMGATVAKIGAGVLAAGAIATGTTGHLPLLGSAKHRDDAKPAVRHAPRAAATGATVLAVSSPAANVVGDHGASSAEGAASGHRGARHGRQHGGVRGGEHRSGRQDGGGDRSGRSQDGGRSGSGSGSGGDDGGRSGSGSSGSGRGGDSGSGSDGGGRNGSGSGGGDDGGRSGTSSGSGDDGGRSGSGSGGGSGSGSDDGATLSGDSGSGGGSGSSSGSSSGDGSGSGTSGGSGGGDSGSGSDDGGTFLSSGSGGGDGSSGGGDRSTSGGSSLVGDSSGGGSDGGSDSGSDG